MQKIVTSRASLAGHNTASRALFQIYSTILAQIFTQYAAVAYFMVKQRLAPIWPGISRSMIGILDL